MQASRLPAGGENKFQRIKRLCAEAEKAGIKIWKLSIGQPSGPAFLSARSTAATAVMSESESMHEYQDNGSPGILELAKYSSKAGAPDVDLDFSKRFIQAIAPGVDFDNAKVSFLPIPGIKPMLWAVPLACGEREKITVLTHTAPGYPTSADACNTLGIKNSPLDAGAGSKFLFDPASMPRADLLMLNFPHNPSGQISEESWLHPLCAKASADRTRVFVDAAYASHDHSGRHSPFARRHRTLAGVGTLGPVLGRGLFLIQVRQSNRLAGRGDGRLAGLYCGHCQNQG